MRHAAVPGENFARLETFARGKMLQHAAAAAGKVLEIPPGGRDGQIEEPARALRLVCTMRPCESTVTMPRESDSMRARKYWLVVARSRMRSRSRNWEVTVSAAWRTRPRVCTCIMADSPLSEMAPSTTPPSGAKTGAPALLKRRASAENMASPGQKNRHLLLQGQTDGAGAHVALQPAIAGQAAPPFEMLHQFHIPHHVEHIPLTVGQGHAETRAFEQAVERVDLRPGQVKELPLPVDPLAPDPPRSDLRPRARRPDAGPGRSVRNARANAG